MPFFAVLDALANMSICPWNYSHRERAFCIFLWDRNHRATMAIIRRDAIIHKATKNIRKEQSKISPIHRPFLHSRSTHIPIPKRYFTLALHKQEGWQAEFVATKIIRWIWTKNSFYFFFAFENLKFISLLQRLWSPMFHINHTKLKPFHAIILLLSSYSCIPSFNAHKTNSWS